MASLIVVIGRMRVRRFLLALPLSLLVACSTTPVASPGPTNAPTGGPTTAPTPSPATGIEGLVQDLNARGLTAKVGSPFLAEPMPGEGTAVCIGTDTLQVYGYIDHEAALAAASRIDRDDPSNVGTAHVTWNGRPRFWLRDRIIVLYLGSDAATDAALRQLLGPPFAESQQPGGGLLPNPPCS